MYWEGQAGKGSVGEEEETEALMNTGIIHVILYLRVSSDGQARDGTSLETQENRLREYAERQGWNVVAIIRDAGESGGTFDRPGIREMLRIIRDRTIQFIVVYKLDRFGRDVADGATLFKEALEPKGVNVRAMDGADTSTDSGRLFFHVGLAFAEGERRKIRQRTKEGREAAARKGHWPGGRAPFGYRYKKDKKKHQIIAEEAHIVRLLFKLYVADRLSTYEITKRLSAHGILTRASTKPGPSWITKRLRDTAYIGQKLYDGKHPIKFPPLIDRDVFAAADELLKKGSYHSRRKAKREFLSIGYVFCGECERMEGRCRNRMRMDSRLWNCQTHNASMRNRPDQHKYAVSPCVNRTVKIEDVDRALWAYVCRLFEDDFFRTEVLHSTAQEAERRFETVEKERNHLQARQKEIKKKQERLLSLALDDIPREIVEAKAAQLRREEETVEAELLRTQRVFAEAAAAKQAAAGTIRVRVRDLHEMSFKDRCSLLKVLFSEKGDGLYIDRNHKIEFRGRWTPQRIERLLNPEPMELESGARLPLIGRKDWTDLQHVRSRFGLRSGYSA